MAFPDQLERLASLVSQAPLGQLDRPALLEQQEPPVQQVKTFDLILKYTITLNLRLIKFETKQKKTGVGGAPGSPGSAGAPGAPAGR